MKPLETTGAVLGAWTGSVAAAIISGFDRAVSPRVVRLIEGDDGGFAVETAAKSDNGPARIAFAEGTLSAPNLAPMFRGSRVEIVLQPKRFLFRPLELPARAAGFLDGIVRAQIDRLTPWSASEAVFGCSAPVESGSDSITTVIAATTRKVAMTYVQAVSGFHPAAIAVCADVAERNAGRVKVFEQKARGHLDAARLSRALSAGLGVLAVAALLSAIAAGATAVLAKLGVEGIPSNLATAIRTIVILALAWAIVLARGEHHGLGGISRRSLVFLVLSGLATGLSWLAYYRALQLGPASRVAPIVSAA